MAMVLDAFASYVQNMLTEMVNEKVHMLLGVEDETDTMEIMLRDLKNFLADADRRNITDESVQEWVGQLKRAMYEAADILDLCQLKAMECGPSTLHLGRFNPLLFFMRNPAHAHDIGTRIKALNKRLGTIKERSATFSFINLCSYEDRSTRVDACRSDNPRETSGESDRLGVVGEKIKEDTRRLVEIMLSEKEGNPNIMVVAIVGVGGIGKTTLAQKVFNDETLKAEFDKTVWLSINKNFDKVELIKTIITQAGGKHGGETVLAVLHPILTTALTGKKLFLVLDDVWSQKAWGDVLETPLANVVARGSRVLITTRDERVARGTKAVIPYHHVDKLEEEDAWSLLTKQIISTEADGREIDMLKDIGLQIVAKCDGLPLAIKVMGGILCQRDRKRCDWEIILNDSIWSVSEISKELNHVVQLSYEDLPSCIKQCFLYYSLLPKTRTFYRSNIIGMWISEGFIHGGSEDLEELGTKYYKELIVRNLIEPDIGYVDQCVCNMHDVVRSFGQFVARDEALAAHSGETNIVSKLNTQKFLRVSLESCSSESNGLDWSSLEAQTTLRTLISVGHMNMKPGDSLVHFSCLRTLDTDSVGVVALAESLHEFKHLRYLSLQNSDISSLPDNIGEMKFLQYISLSGSQQFVKLPDSIVKLRQLRYLNFNKTSIYGIPRGFHVLTNLRIIRGFPALEDGDWCSLEELGPLSQLSELGLEILENVTAPSSTEKAKLGEKVHLYALELTCGSRLGDNGLTEEKDIISEEEKQRIEQVFDELCPPQRLDNLSIKGYFGRHLPRWMMSSSVVPLKNLRILMAEDLACCTQLPNGLCQLPYLELIQINRAPAIKHVGPEFLESYHPQSRHSSQAVAVFPRLRQMILLEMLEWEEWEWEEQVQAFPVLQKMIIKLCKLRRLPPGLASQARSLNELAIKYVQGLISVENFASLVELEVFELLDLERITNLPRLQKLTITNCPKLKVLEGVAALQRLILDDNDMETLPEYMKSINPRHLVLYCTVGLLASIAGGQSGLDGTSSATSSMSKHMQMKEKFQGNGTLSSFEDVQRFESVFKMTRKTFNYICSLVIGPAMEDMNSYTFIDGSVLCFEDQVAIALRRLSSSEPPETLESSVGVKASTVLLVTERFVNAVFKRAMHHLRWPDSSEVDKIKSIFEKSHNMPNCCGVICTTHVPFGPNWDHVKNGRFLLQFVVDPKMRFTNVSPGMASMNKLGILQDSLLFRQCEKGAWLNGSKLKVALDGSEVGEYIIGDAEYPLLPWLLTPFQEQDLSDCKAEFNRRHKAATTFGVEALERFKDTWKYLQAEAWWPVNWSISFEVTIVCCMLHNIVIDMEDNTAKPRAHANDWDHYQQVRQLANEDAVRGRDILSQHFLTSRSCLSGAASGSGMQRRPMKRSRH